VGRKKQASTLIVYLNNRVVGRLDRAGTGALSFAYDPSWLNDKNSIDISSSLPRSGESYAGAVVYSYFENLLPDSKEIRAKIAQKVKAESSEVFDLLNVIGKDCVGALQFLPENSDISPELKKIQGRRLSEDEIELKLKNLAQSPLGLRANDDFRISIAGVQEKTAFLRLRGKWCEPIGTNPTSHIFKPAIGKLFNGLDMTQSVENEWLCLLIAKKLGLPVANASIERFGKTRSLVVERFDRVLSPDKKYLYRLPTEDLCQTFGIPSNKKYQSDGGPGIKQIMEFLDTSSNRDLDRATFMRAQIVFQLLGAIDGHAKNFSVFLGSNALHLAPLYDILTIYPAAKSRQIERKEIKLAMSVGKSKKYKINEINKSHWYQTAEICAFVSDYLDEIFEDLNDKIGRLESDLTEIPKDFPEELIDVTLKGIRNEAKKLWHKNQN
jgi:serine/threonine-protein kinase HipA